MMKQLTREEIVAVLAAIETSCGMTLMEIGVRYTTTPALAELNSAREKLRDGLAKLPRKTL